jgi:hypothetical protein
VFSVCGYKVPRRKNAKVIDLRNSNQYEKKGNVIEDVLAFSVVFLLGIEVEIENPSHWRSQFLREYPSTFGIPLSTDCEKSHAQYVPTFTSTGSDTK